MDLFQHRYYRLNRTLLKLIGLWPYQRTSVRFASLTIMLCFCITHLVPQMMAIAKNLNNWNLLVEAAQSALFGAFCIAKYFACVFNVQQMLMILSHIRSNWEVWSQDRDVDIMHEYAEKGRKMTVAYVVGVYTVGTFFTIQPAVPKIIDVLLKNGTKPGRFPVPVDYHYIDEQDYYFYIVLHSYMTASLGFFVLFAYDCMFMVFIQHGCGLFAILGRKLQRIGKIDKLTKSEQSIYKFNRNDMDFEHLVSCITLHNHAIEYADLLEKTYSWCFFYVTGCNMLLISITGFQIVTKTTDPEEGIRFIGCCGVAVTHLYIYSYLGQSLIDHSISICYYIMNGQWYILPLKIQKIFYFMIMRSNVPCQITAGKMSVMCIENFAVLLKTSVSYFTLLRSA